MEPSFVKEGRQRRRQTSQSNSYCWSYYFSNVNNRPKGKEQYNVRCTLESLYMKRWCTDTTLPTEGSAALRPLSSFSARGSCWRVIAVSECASYSCGSFWDTVSSCTLGWNQEAVDSHREATLKYGVIRAARVKWSLQLSSPCYYGLWTDWLDRTGGRLEETRAFQTSSRLWHKSVLSSAADILMPRDGWCVAAC